MAQGNAFIRTSANNGPIVWFWSVDGEGTAAATGVANFNSAIDSIKTQVAGMSGTVKSVNIVVTTT